eukprot:1433049-Pyramimonas_sp.AAC.1
MRLCAPTPALASDLANLGAARMSRMSQACFGSSSVSCCLSRYQLRWGPCSARERLRMASPVERASIIVVSCCATSKEYALTWAISAFRFSGAPTFYPPAASHALAASAVK